MNLVANLISTILTAIQKPAFGGLVAVGVNVFSLVGVAYLSSRSDGSLLSLSLVIGFSLVLSPILLSLYVFLGPHRSLRPSWKYFNHKNGRAIVGSGLRFFILQIGFVIAYSSVNLIISQFYGPTEVTPYSIAMKYYSAAAMVFTILLTPFWSAYTDAFVRDDRDWIRHSIGQLRKAWLILLIAVLLMTVVSKIVYRVWIGTGVEVPLILSISVALYVLSSAWCNIYVNVTNGTGKIQLQLWAAVFVCISIFPVSLGLRAIGFAGSASVSFSVVLCLLPWCFVWPVQVQKILLGTASGIWNR